MIVHSRDFSTCLVATTFLSFFAASSQTPYPLAQYRGDDIRDRWIHPYRSNYRRRGPFGHYTSYEHTTLDPLSRFHYAGIRPRYQNPVGIDSQATNSAQKSSVEEPFVPIVQRRKLIRPHKPPLIPIPREGGLVPFRYSTDNGNYKTEEENEQTTTEGTTTNRNSPDYEETRETKSYIGMPGYWKPIRVSPYGYAYPRWYHVQRTKSTQSESPDDAEQSIEDPRQNEETSSEESTPSPTTEQAQEDLGLNYRPPQSLLYPTNVPTYPPQFPPSFPPPYQAYPTPYSPFNNPHFSSIPPSIPSNFSPSPPSPAHSIPPHFSPLPPYMSTAPSPMDFHTWLNRQQSLNQNQQTTTPTKATESPATETDISATAVTTIETQSTRPTMIFPTSSTIRKPAATTSPTITDVSNFGMSTSETSTFYTNLNPTQNSLQPSQATFIGPARNRPFKNDRQQHRHHLASDSDEQQRSASEVEMTIRTHQEDSQDEQERLRAGEVAGMVIGIVSLIATLVGCVTFLILKKPLAVSDEPVYPSPEPPITSIQRTFPGGVMYSGEHDVDDEEVANQIQTHVQRKMQPIQEWSYSPASSIRLSFEEVHQAAQQQNDNSQAPSRASMNVAADQRPNAFI